MDIIARAAPLLIGLLLFGALIVIHEFGHFIAARGCGVAVLEFAVGMGKKLFGFKIGETEYSLRALPIGGFCKMLGEDENSPDDRAFTNKSVIKRMIIILAGAFMNMVLAVVMFALVMAFTGFGSSVIDTVAEGSPAQKAGILPGDEILRINGAKTRMFDLVSFEISSSGGEAVDIVIKRDSGKVTKTVTPVFDKNENKYVIGVMTVSKNGVFSKRYGATDAITVFESVSAGFWQMEYLVKLTFSALGGLFTRKTPVSDLSGPIYIVGVIGESYNAVVKYGAFQVIIMLMEFMGMLSASIGLFNILPLPGLDGGRFAFLALEAARRKPLPPEKEGMVHFVGLALLVALGIFVAYHDVLKIISGK
ncbi:MAG: site-2 protease family protein [Clostridiales bacterium]|jgi:regulator of sigma E protease|nr:site-2 protease family protein [Clostridiales bacterium]